MSWIISQALMKDYENSHHSPEQEAGFSAELSSDGEPSAPLKSNPMPQLFCAPDRMTAFSRLSRFGMTCGVLTESRGGELLTSYLAGFRVRTSASPEKGKVSAVNAPGCGRKWQESFARYDRATSSWKTPQCSLFGGGASHWRPCRNGV